MIYNFLSHFNYFTIYYTGFVVTAFVIFVGTMIVCRNLSSSQVDKNKQKSGKVDEEPEDDWSTIGSGGDGLQARYKRAKQKSYIPPNLTHDQINQEKKSELESLNAIYKLLQEREDIYPEATMNDLKHQLNLYKPVK